MVSFGTIGTVVSAIELLREVLEKSGVDRARAAQIAGEFMSKLRSRGGASASTGDKSQGSEVSEIIVPEIWEYTAVGLAPVKLRRGVTIWAPRVRDGAEIPGPQPPELASYLNQAADDGWEIVTTIGPSDTPTLLLRRVKR